MSTPNNDGPNHDDPNHDDPALRGLLDDAVSGVHPTGTSDQVRARAKRPATSRGWVPVTLAAAVATVLVITGVSWLGQRDTSTPAASPGTAEADPADTVKVPVYYTGRTAGGPRLFKETHEVAGTKASALQAAVDEALSGRPQDPDYSGWVVPDTTAKASAGSDRISIDLTFDSSSSSVTADGAPRVTVQAVSDGLPALAVQALVRTAQDATGTDLPVQVTTNGKKNGDFFGVDLSEPLQPTSADQTLSPVSITTPGEGARVGSRFEVTGQASAVEANVIWELKQGDRVVRTGFATAEECCTLSPFEFTVTAEPGDYTLVVHDTDESDGEGTGLTRDTKNITVE